MMLAAGVALVAGVLVESAKADSMADSAGGPPQVERAVTVR